MTDAKTHLEERLTGEAESSQDLDAVIYARTSSSSQQFGYSIEGQVRRCWDRCQQMGWKVTHLFRDEAVSGKDKDRPMFQQLLSRGEAGAFDVVVFWKLDRFSRSLMHAVQLEKDFREWGIALHSVTEQIDTTTPTGRFNFRNISSASEFERDLNQQRSQMGMRQLALEAKWPNDHPPLGYNKRTDERLEIDPEEATIVRRMFKRYLDLKSMPELAEQLNTEGIRIKKGNSWSPRAVGDVLRNELYTGQYEVAEITKHVNSYQILSETLFERVTSVRTRFKRKDSSTNRKEMPQARRERRVEHVVNQFREFLEGE